MCQNVKGCVLGRDSHRCALIEHENVCENVLQRLYLATEILDEAGPTPRRRRPRAVVGWTESSGRREEALPLQDRIVSRA